MLVATFSPIFHAVATAPTTCVTGAWSDPTYRPASKPPGRNQAIWMRGISTNLVFTPDPGSWVESANGTAQLTGSARSLTNMTSGFVVTLYLTGLQTNPPAGSPKLDLDTGAYVQNGGPLNPATWHYYTGATGMLTGFGFWQGAQLTLTPYQPAFQVGVGASGKNQKAGAAGWLNWKVTHQPGSGSLPTTGECDFTLDFAACAASTVGDLVWQDLNGNGLQDAGEPGAAGVEVRLTDCAGTDLAVGHTDTNGRYSFTNLVAGSYQVRFISPPGWSPTAPQLSGNDATDSDADASGLTRCITLGSFETNFNVDAGFMVVPSLPVAEAASLWKVCALPPRSSSEPEVMHNFRTVGTKLILFYNDEEPLLLGVSNVIVYPSSGSPTTNAFGNVDFGRAYPWCFPNNLAGVIGSTSVDVANDFCALDTSQWPIFPALYITDQTTNGCWGPILPEAVFGAWKYATKTVDHRNGKNTVSYSFFDDHNTWGANGSNLGCGDPPPSGLKEYSAEVRWELNSLGLLPGHKYQLDFIVHDGDQTKEGGDVGLASTIYYVPTVDACIQVTKTCSVPIAPNTVTYIGSVSNCNAAVLTNVVVSNLVAGVWSRVFGPTILATNQILYFTNTYQWVNLCAPAMDTLLAMGTDPLGQVSFSSASAVCLMPLEPAHVFCPSDKVVECGAAWTFDTPTATNSLRILSTVTNSTGFCGRTFSATRTWSVTNACGSNICSQTVTVVDTTPPHLTCAESLILECGTPWQFTAPFANDVCDGTNVTISVVSTVTNRAGYCGKSFSATRTWRAVDSCTNISTCSQSITVVDTTPPVLTCAGNLIVECGLPWDFKAPSVNDVCDGTNVAISMVSTVTNRAGYCGRTFSATRTWMATDACTNSSMCSQSITVVDTTPPVLTCAGNLIVECGTPWDFKAPSANDVCDGTNVAINVVTTTTNRIGYCGKTFSATRTWMAVDLCTNASMCSQTITVVDTTPPDLRCAANLIVDSSTNWSFLAPFANDVCDGTNVTIQIVSTVTNVAGYCGKSYTATRTWRAYDSCTNIAICSQTITVGDTAAPTLSCGASAVLECGVAWNFTPPFANDSYDGTNVIVSVVSTVTNRLGYCGRSYSATRTWQAIDSCTNIATCSQTMTIVDTTPPSLGGVPNLILDCGTPWSFATPSVNDACDGTNVAVQIVSTVTNTAGYCGKSYSATRTWRATDSCTNTSTFSQTVTVVDSTPPQLNCAADKIVECGLPWSFTPPTATDTCDGTVTNIQLVGTVTNTAGYCGKTFSATRTWRAIDSCSNNATCSQTIVVVDTQPPALTCAGDRFVECGFPWSFTAPSVSDICDGTNVNVVTLSTTTNALCGKSFIAVRTWRATDLCTNSATCSQTIYVVDTTPPNLFCAHDQIVECGNSWNFTPPSPTDICDGTNVLLTIVSTVTNSAGLFPPSLFSATRTWRAADLCSNSAVCSQNILVVDTTPPTLTCAANLILECGSAWDFTPPFATDTCNGTNVTIRILSTVTNVPNPRCPKLISATRTWSATDSSSNLAVCSQTITLVDTAPPELVCASDQILECGNPLIFIAPFAVDVCDGTNVSVTIVSTVTNAATPRCPSLVTVTRTWKANDTCSNSVTCSQAITFVDTTPPTLTCAGSLIFECGIPWDFKAPFASDICNGTNVTISIVSTVTNTASPRCPRLFSATRTWMATDGCSNSSMCAQTISVVDTMAPVFTSVPANALYQCLAEVPPAPPLMAVDVCESNRMVTARSFTNGACPLYITNVWSAGDSCGNTDTVTQIIRVWDTIPPLLIGVPANSTISCLDAPPPATVTAIDNCDTNVAVHFTAITNGSPPTNIIYCWGATDACHNVAVACQTNSFLNLTNAVIGLVWNDLNGNGIRDEVPVAGVPGVTVCLLNATGILNSVATDGKGAYLFNNLKAGTYQVRILLPSGFSFCPKHVGIDSLDSDADPRSGMTDQVSLNCGVTVLDAGVVSTCYTMEPCTPPYPTNLTPLASIPFNESEVLRYFTNTLSAACSPQYICAFYNDERALLLGLTQVVTKTASGTITTNFPFTPMGASNPSYQTNPLVGCTNIALSNGPAAIDPFGRPLFPALFVTDLTTNRNEFAGDWQFGGTPIPPHAVFGTWKSASEVIDLTHANQTNITITTAGDPAKNNWNLGSQADLVPAGLVNQGYGAEVRWDLSRLGLIPGHSYRFYFMIHDGDQNKQGGDVGQACVFWGPVNQPVSAAATALGGSVWNDRNGDGVRDANAPGVANVSIRLLDAQANLLATAATDEQGMYLFTGMEAGHYQVAFTAPSGASFTTPGAAAPGSGFSPAATAPDLTQQVDLYPAEVNMSVNAGLLLPVAPAQVNAPKMLWPAFLTNGRVQIRTASPVGSTLRIEASSDLLHWNTVTTLVNQSGVIEFGDSANSGAARRFYRLFLMP